MIAAARASFFMFSIIIPSHDLERALVPTLAALVPGATAGIVREVIVADGGSRDETEQVADLVGCRFFVSREPLGARLKAAAAIARADWLMFISPGAVPDVTWIDETAAFAEKAGADARAAVFAPIPDWTGVAGAVRAILGRAPAGQLALIIRKSLYNELGGHPNVPRPDGRNAAPPRAATPRPAAHGDPLARHLTPSSNCLTLSPIRPTGG